MQLIIVDEKHDVSRTVTSWGWVRLGLSLCLLGLPVFLGCLGLQFADPRNSVLQKDHAAQAWVQGLRDQKADLERLSQQTLIQLKALTLGLASWHTGLARPNLIGADRANAAGADQADVSLAGGPAGFTAPGEGLQQGRRQDSGNWSFPDQPLHALAGNAVRHALALASSLACTAYQLHSPLQRNKHGRLIDPASYLHATIR